ncbi:MAG: hypothetical protein WCO11_03500 [Sphingomonadales bacterium]
MSKKIHIGLAFTMLALSVSANGNGVGENASWQFQTTAELANRAYIEDLRRKQQSGFYSSAVTNIQNQNNFNCSNAANAAGNGGSNAATANTPASTGPTSSAVGNQNTSSVAAQQDPYRTVLNSGQENWGLVSSAATGDSLASASGNTTRQVLNTYQSNPGVQDASVNGSTACGFASVTGVSR